MKEKVNKNTERLIESMTGSTVMIFFFAIIAARPKSRAEAKTYSVPCTRNLLMSVFPLKLIRNAPARVKIMPAISYFPNFSFKITIPKKVIKNGLKLARKETMAGFSTI